MKGKAPGICKIAKHPLSGLSTLEHPKVDLLSAAARFGAWLIALFLVGVTPMMHRFWTVPDPTMHQMQMVMFMENLAMLGGALVITQIGSGPWSLDSRRK
jgi:putative oxidoreductase